MKHDTSLTPLAQKLRREMTRQERKLWYDYLRYYPVQFRRQVPVAGYILDFYCARARLAVELDGSQHYDPEGAAHDAQRTLHLEKLGILVVRVSNTDVMKNLSGVCEMIDETVKRRTSEKAFPYGEGVTAAGRDG